MIFNSLIATSLVSLVSFVGLFLLKRSIFRDKRVMMGIVSFAAGVMLSVGVLDLLPEALELVQDPHIVLTWFLVGIVGFFLLERFLFWHHHHEGQEKPVIKMVLIGDSLHNLLDGVAIASSFVISPALGMSTTLAIIAHEIPQEISDFGLLLSMGWSKRKALFFNFVSALFAIVGALLVYFLGNIVSSFEYIALAVTGGMFVYISCADLIPELHDHSNQNKGKYDQLIQVGLFLLGILLMIH